MGDSALTATAAVKSYNRVRVSLIIPRPLYKRLYLSRVVVAVGLFNHRNLSDVRAVPPTCSIRTDWPTWCVRFP